MIVGVDEVGRGCWAGPLCVGAVILSDRTNRILLKDSKTVSSKKRATTALHIKQTAKVVALGWASARYIDDYGLSQALQYATTKAVSQITLDYDEIIIDGTVNFLPNNPKVTLLAKADNLIPAVSAASLVAKVARDQYMQAIDSYFSGYEFAAHVGYGTAAHKLALNELGPSAIHRMSFAPLTQLAKTNPRTYGDTAGSFAESRAAHYLENVGFKVIERNWKTKWCEVDIIATKNNILHFVEVKYRATDTAGRGLEYITAQKQRQMQFAAEFWLQQQKTQVEAQLSVIEVSGEEFKITAFIERII